MPEDGDAAELDRNPLRDIEIDVAEENDRRDGRDVAAELRLTKVEVGVSDENAREAESRQAPPARALGVTEDDHGEASRPLPGMLRRQLRRLEVELLQLGERGSGECPIRSLGELLERQASAGSILAQSRDRPLAIRVGGEGGPRRDGFGRARRWVFVRETRSHGLVDPDRAVEAPEPQLAEVAELDLAEFHLI